MDEARLALFRFPDTRDRIRRRILKKELHFGSTIETA